MPALAMSANDLNASLLIASPPGSRDVAAKDFSGNDLKDLRPLELSRTASCNLSPKGEGMLPSSTLMCFRSKGMGRSTECCVGGGSAPAGALRKDDGCEAATGMMICCQLLSGLWTDSERWTTLGPLCECGDVTSKERRRALSVVISGSSFPVVNVCLRLSAPGIGRLGMVRLAVRGDNRRAKLTAGLADG